MDDNNSLLVLLGVLAVVVYFMFFHNNMPTVVVNFMPILGNSLGNLPNKVRRMLRMAVNDNKAEEYTGLKVDVPLRGTCGRSFAERVDALKPKASEDDPEWAKKMGKATEGIWDRNYTTLGFSTQVQPSRTTCGRRSVRRDLRPLPVIRSDYATDAPVGNLPGVSIDCVNAHEEYRRERLKCRV